MFVENPGKDVFGFDELIDKKEREKAPPKDDDLPIRAFNLHWMMDNLARKKLGGKIKATETMIDGIIWGEWKKVGTIRVRVMPNITVYVERMIQDLNGTRTWVLKHVLKPNIREYAGSEDVVANDIFEYVEKVHFENFDSPSEDYDSLLTLAKRMATRLRTVAPDGFSFQDIKEVNKDYYVISFALRNAGVGKLVTRTQNLQQSPEATIDVNYKKDRGLIHVILTTVSVGGDGQSGWEVDLPFLDAWYAPTQKKDEIIESVMKVLKFY